MKIITSRRSQSLLSAISFAAVILAITRPCTAIVRWVDTDATLDELNPVEDYNYSVGYASQHDAIHDINPTSPTLTLTDNASIWGDIRAFNGSTIAMQGGTLLGDIDAYETSHVAMTGGEARGLIAHDQSSIMMSGGTIQAVGAIDAGTVSVTGGTVLTWAQFFGTSTATISGVTIGSGGVYNIWASGESNVTLSGVIVSQDVLVDDAAYLVASQTTLDRDLLVQDNANAAFDGGQIGRDVSIINDATLSISNMQIGGSLTVRNSADMTSLHGSRIGNDLIIDAPTSSIISSTQIGDSASISKAAVEFDAVTVVHATSVSTGGSLLVTSGDTKVQMLGGSVSHNVNLSGRAAFHLIGGTIAGNLDTTGTPTATLTAGYIAGNIHAGGGQVMLNGTSVAGDAVADRFGTINLFGRPVNGEISAAGGFIYQYGGNYDQATAAGGTYQLEGGTIHQLTATPGGALNIYGGEVTDRASLDMGNYVQLGGTVHTVVADNISGVYLFDGIISTNVGVANGSSLNIQNGSINQNVTVIESQLYMFGGSVAGDVELANNSNADIYGGTISGNLRVSSNAQVLLGGSVAGDIDGDDHATIQLFEGASVGGQVRLIKYSKLSADLMNNTGLFIDSVRSDVSLLRSHVGAVRVMDHSKLSIEESRLHGGLTAEKTFIQFNSGDVDLQFTLLSSDVRFNRGCIHTDLIATGDSKVRMSGGNISGDVYIRNYSSFRMTGGRINGKLVVASQNATVNLIGGYIGGLIIGDPLEITFASVLDNPMLDSLTGLVALDDAVINIYGTDLVATLVDPVYQDGMFSLYEFTGILSDGTQVLGGNLVIQNGTTASFHFLPPIPEPGTAILLLALLPLAGTLWWRQRSGNSSMDQPTFQQALTTAPIQAACDLGIELAEPMDNSETVGSLHGHLRSHVISPKYAPISVMPSGLN